MTSFVLKMLPDGINHLDIDYPRNANRLIARYDGMVESVDNPEILTTILFMQEAVQSSKIEGTIATISDILDYNVGHKLDERKSIDIQEIDNYKEALEYTLKEVEDSNYEINPRLLKNIQHILLNNSRGKDKLKGEFKRSQNYIGNKFEGKITYTPVSHILTPDYITNLIDFINSDDFDKLDSIVKVAIIHAQFELIHPFEDGNGRVGRILVPILLKKYKIIEEPFFYISYFLSKNRDEYISCLEKISTENNWESWINFFVKGVEEQSKVLMEVLKELNSIKKDTKDKITSLKTTFALQIVDFLFQKIKFDTAYFIEKTEIKAPTARKLLKDLVDNNILSIESVGSGQKSTIYRFDALYSVIEQLEN